MALASSEDEAAAENARRETTEAARDLRANVAVGMNVIAGLVPLGVGIAAWHTETLRAVEDAMEVYIAAVLFTVPFWLITVVVAIISFRARAIATCVLCPLAWFVVTRFAG